MFSKIEAAIDSYLEGMEKANDNGCLSYTGAVELEGVVAGVSVLFFKGGLCRAVVQLTEVPEAHTSPALRLCARINRYAIYRATMEENVFVLSLDMLIDEHFDPELVAQGLYAMLDGARAYHIEELRAFMGELSNILPPPEDGGPLN